MRRPSILPRAIVRRPPRARPEHTCGIFLSRLPVQIDFTERTPPETDAATNHVMNLAVPQGFAVASGNAKLHAQALDYAEKNNIDYSAAVLAVGGA